MPFESVKLTEQLAGFGFFFFVLAIALHEAVYTPFGVHNLLLTGVEGVTGTANLYTDRLLGGTELDFVAADTAGDNFVILGMNSFFHNSIPDDGNDKEEIISKNYMPYVLFGRIVRFFYVVGL